MTGDLSIVCNQKLKDVLRKGSKYRESVSFLWHHNFNIIMGACEEYARRWPKKADVEVDTISKWVKSIADVLKRRIRRLNALSTPDTSQFYVTPEVVRELSRLNENFDIVPADKASNNYTLYNDILSRNIKQSF